MSSDLPPASGGIGLGSAIATRPRVPAVNLMPAYVAKRQAGRALQIKAGIVLVLVVLGLGGGFAGLSIWKGMAESRHSQAQDESKRLAKERERYAEVIQVKEDLQLTADALLVAVSYEIRWPELVDAMFANVPEGANMDSMTLRGMSATEAAAPSDSVLAYPGIGGVSLSVEVPSMPAVAAWVRGFNSIPGLEEGVYTSAIKQATPGGEVWAVTCSAQVNLVGLVGSEFLPKDFQEWLLAAQHPEAEVAPNEEGTD
ncbi:MAG: hypothetical protein LBS27_00905 [Bifidobacteriaceae bacterium]|jgi:hypothetical protein|nr:hypothetical protein [Bifidobacteriaceae bacterium]